MVWSKALWLAATLTSTTTIVPDGRHCLKLPPLANETFFQTLLRDGRSAPDAKDATCRSSLSYAAESGYKAIVNLLLLVSGVDMDSRDNKGRTPLSYAAEHGHYGLISIFLRTGNVNVDLADSSGRTALSHAAERGRTSVVLYMITCANAAVDSKDSAGRTPLHYAAEFGHAEIASALIQHQADINAKDKYGRAPLLYAAAVDHFVGLFHDVNIGRHVNPCVKLLCEYDGCDVNTVDSKGRSPLFYAVLRNDHEVVRALLATGEIESVEVDVNSAETSFIVREMLIDYRDGWRTCPLMPVWMFGGTEPTTREEDKVGEIAKEMNDFHVQDRRSVRHGMSPDDSEEESDGESDEKKG